MRLTSLVLALLLATWSGHPAFAFSCADVPWWVHNYSRAEIAKVTRQLGMTYKQIDRLLRCFKYTQDKGVGP